MVRTRFSRTIEDLRDMLDRLVYPIWEQAIRDRAGTEKSGASVADQWRTSGVPVAFPQREGSVSTALAQREGGVEPAEGTPFFCVKTKPGG